MVLYAFSRRALELVVWGLTSVVLVQSVITSFLPQVLPSLNDQHQSSFLTPLLVQCGNIHIVWQRSTATGPNNVGPYYLQIYTSIYIVPIIIPVGNVLIYDWQVPFPPGTLYQICMFDTNGNTGGCQATYTVIANTTVTTPTCANVTFPPLLSIDAQVNNGPLSQVGWIDQCSDISITPKNGTPPYLLTIAPALHPPYNISSPDMRSINWTVSLSWASPFFISVVDSAGNMWANGLLHSGQGSSSACLAGNTTSTGSSTVKSVVAIGSGVGGLALGLFIGVLTAFFFLRRHYKKKDQRRSVYMADSMPNSPHALLDPPTTMGTSSQYAPIPFGNVADTSLGSSNPSSASNYMGRSSGYAVEPFVMPGEDGRRSELPSGPGRALSAGSTSHAPQNQVYVVHHDSQAPPVTIYHEDGTQVVELPPRYLAGASSPTSARSVSDTRSDGGRTESTSEPPSFLREHRRPTTVKKPAKETIYLSNPTT
ncbi:uncharacterized protein LACBIDRAFT_298423 [Laccaria bicolor S238N-H82]|uniref:Predicted protein n=1 Tax=Laccaria bicolor (strain S238N-H82 / ATCC MYA-4686) TaxID=486041 RepID=B0DCT8_LACBS|nr:uncharacterized protein LACBIDRAFT_298423 [Laccaria bicolor S238N-H82]EDR07351.1 predicted protein [Laccaria bicolor S238N-H82]|eukprot:XP_001881743.1 predicted protein [Laccaria bicolor S238N-H82]